VDCVRFFSEPKEGERVRSLLITRGVRNARGGRTTSPRVERGRALYLRVDGGKREGDGIMNAEAREQIFLAMVEDFSEVIARHLPNFDNNIKDETWKLLELFTEEAIQQLAV
jgi:hypothetical protein